MLNVFRSWAPVKNILVRACAADEKAIKERFQKTEFFIVIKTFTYFPHYPAVSSTAEFEIKILRLLRLDS